MKNYNTKLIWRQQKHQLDRLEKLTNMNFLQVKKYYHRIKVEKYKKLGLHFFLSLKHLKNKQKRLKSKEKNK